MRKIVVALIFAACILPIQSFAAKTPESLNLKVIAFAPGDNLKNQKVCVNKAKIALAEKKFTGSSNNNGAWGWNNSGMIAVIKCQTEINAAVIAVSGSGNTSAIVEELLGYFQY